jgi:hypothetical protein
MPDPNPFSSGYSALQTEKAQLFGRASIFPDDKGYMEEEVAPT